MKLILTFSFLILISCNARQSEIENQFEINYKIINAADDQIKLTILVKYLGGKIEIWSHNKGQFKYSGIGKLSENEFRGFGNGVSPIYPYKLIPGDTVEKSLYIDKFNIYKSLVLKIWYFKSKSDCEYNTNEINVYSIKLK